MSVAMLKLLFPLFICCAAISKLNASETVLAHQTTSYPIRITSSFVYDMFTTTNSFICSIKKTAQSGLSDSTKKTLQSDFDTFQSTLANLRFRQLQKYELLNKLQVIMYEYYYHTGCI